MGKIASMDRVWVDSNFKKMLKKEAAEQGLSILKFTENISKDTSIDQLAKKTKKGERNLFRL